MPNLQPNSRDLPQYRRAPDDSRKLLAAEMMRRMRSRRLVITQTCAVIAQVALWVMLAIGDANGLDSAGSIVARWLYFIAQPIVIGVYIWTLAARARLTATPKSHSDRLTNRGP